MQTFDFPYHSVEVIYPDSSPKMTFGRGYEFAAKPNGPDQVTFRLHFPTLAFFLGAGGKLDYSTQRAVNLARLIRFYETHRLYEKFIYPSPIYGNTIVRFAKPLTYKQVPGGMGTSEPIIIELLTQP